MRAFSEASPGRQAVFREAVDGVRAGLLLVFSERVAALAVRLQSGEPIVQGSWPPRSPRRATRARRSPCRRCTAAARRSWGSTPAALFDEAAGRTDLSGARWLRDVRDAEDAPEDVGYEEADDGEGFRYERAIARQPRPLLSRSVACGAVNEQPRDPNAHTEVHRVADPSRRASPATWPSPARSAASCCCTRAAWTRA